MSNAGCTAHYAKCAVVSEFVLLKNLQSHGVDFVSAKACFVAPNGILSVRQNGKELRICNSKTSFYDEVYSP